MCLMLSPIKRTNGELGEKVTDERFERLMLYCGDVKHLEVRDAWCDAPEGFEGVYFNSRPPRSLAVKFASLTTVVLTGCESVDGASIVELMKAIGMLARPKKDRLRRLHVHGCALGDDEVATLSDCVSLGRLENYVAWSKEQGTCDGIDVCVCLNCDDVIRMLDCYMCYSCLDTCCEGSTEEIWGPTCDGCPANVCDKAECAASLRWFDCAGCGETFCGDCESSGKITVCRGSDADEGCFESFCNKCDESIFYSICMACHGRWCEDCLGGDSDFVVYECLEDLDGCGTAMCSACANAQKREFFSCSHCETHRCTVCNPELKQSVCRFCGYWWCDKCDPGTRPIVDTLLDGFQVGARERCPWDRTRGDSRLRRDTSKPEPPTRVETRAHFEGESHDARRTIRDVQDNRCTQGNHACSPRSKVY